MASGDGEVAATAAAEKVARSCVRIVERRVRSVILHGSLVAGGFLAGRSDIDLLVVIDGALSAAEHEALERLVRDADLGGASGIDLHVVTAAVAGAPARPTPLELHIGRYAGAVGVAVESTVDDEPDLLAELSMARADGRACYGAQPRDVLGEVPAEWVRERGRYWLTRWLSLTDDARHAALMVLTACRIWRFALEGVHCSKVEAARWALARDESLTAVAQAVRQRTVDPGVSIGEAGIKQVLETALRETAVP